MEVIRSLCVAVREPGPLAFRTGPGLPSGEASSGSGPAR